MIPDAPPAAPPPPPVFGRTEPPKNAYFDALKNVRLNNAPLPETSSTVAGVEALTPMPMQELPTNPNAVNPQTSEPPSLSPLTTGEKFQQAANNVSSLPPLRPSEQTAAEAARIEGKKYGFKKDENGKVMLDEKGKPIYEADRDSDHNWWDVVKSIGLGFATGGLPGAIGGGIGGAIDRNYDEKLIDGIKLNRLNQQFGSQAQREQAQQGYDMRETQRKNVEADNARADDALALRKSTFERNSLLGQVRKMTRYKRGENPEFDAKLEAANIEQPDFEPGKKILPRFWDGNGNYKIFNERGGVESVLDEKGQPITDETKATIYANGYAVKPKDALAAETAAGVKNTQYGNDDDEDKVKYENDVREVNAHNQGVDAQILGKKQVVQNLETANDVLRQERARLATNPILNSEQIKQIDGQINSNLSAWRTANGEITTLGGQKKPMPVAPKPRQRVTTPTVNNVGSYSEQQFRKNFEGKYSPAEIEKLVTNAKQQGIIK